MGEVNSINKLNRDFLKEYFYWIYFLFSSPILAFFVSYLLDKASFRFTMDQHWWFLLFLIVACGEILVLSFDYLWELAYEICDSNDWRK